MIRIHLYNIHGLVKSDGLEIGKDADNGGQTIYVYELASHLSQHPDVEYAPVFTRLTDDLPEDIKVRYWQHSASNIISLSQSRIHILEKPETEYAIIDAD